MSTPTEDVFPRAELTPSTVIEGPDGWIARGYLVAIDRYLEVVRQTYDHAIGAWAKEARELLGVRRNYAEPVERPVICPPPGADVRLVALEAIDVATRGVVQTMSIGESFYAAQWQAARLIRDGSASTCAGEESDTP